jgi:hypothetical protein
MNSVIKDLRNFILKEIVSSDSIWRTEGRSNYYSTKYVLIKKNFDTGLWQFSLNGSGESNFYDFKLVGLNNFFLKILFLFIKRSIRKDLNARKHDVLVKSWNNFLKNNKDLDRDNKIDKIIK